MQANTNSTNLTNKHTTSVYQELNFLVHFKKNKRILITFIIFLLSACSPDTENLKSDSVGMEISAEATTFIPLIQQSAVTYPAWTYSMRVWPFDILNPDTPDDTIRSRLLFAHNQGANTVIFYIEEEQAYGTFVDDAGWQHILGKIELLIETAHAQDLKVIAYLNGLEVLTWNARLDENLPSLARNHPDWLQKDIGGQPLVFYAEEQLDWIPANAEDAWVSPFSDWRDLFKDRLGDLGDIDLDGVYIDATSLPGTDVFGEFWGSSDQGFATAFEQAYAIDLPDAVDWDSIAWRKFIYFRHAVIRDYLADLANTARSHGITPFFEMSALDNESGTELGNDNQFTISGGIASSPEIEPDYLENGFYEAFRASKATRDANLAFPMLFLGWGPHMAKEFALTLTHSGNYYPTTLPDFPAFAFMEEIQTSILDRRIPYQHVALIYPMRSKDFTYESSSTLTAYGQAFTTLAANHIPFRILPLETMRSSDLVGIDTVVLAGAESMMDHEYALLQQKNIVLVGENGTRDQWFEPLSRTFDNVLPIEAIEASLPFSINAPDTTYLEYYVDQADPAHFYIFAFSDEPQGELTLSADSILNVTVHTLAQAITTQQAETIQLTISDYLHVIDIKQ